MPTPKNKSAKPKLSANLKKKLGVRMGQVDIKVGFVNALSIKLTPEQLEAILAGIELMKSFDSYYDIPDQDWGTDLVACVVQTMGEEDEAFQAVNSKKMKASMEKAGTPDDLIQHVFWRIKCEATPNNALMTWMSEEQYEQLDYDTVYIFIGILQKQWSVATGETDKADKKIYKNYTSKEDIPEDAQPWESHSLKLVEFIS